MAVHGYGPNGQYTPPTTLATWSGSGPFQPQVARHKVVRIYPLGMHYLPMYPFVERDVFEVQDRR